MNFLLTPFSYDFFRNGALAGILVGALCGMLGVYVVLRGMSYIGHGLSDVVFGGAAVAYITSTNYYLGAGAWGILAALLINQTVRRLRIGADAAIGIVTTASLALGVALISSQHRFTLDLESKLFGGLLGVDSNDILAVLIVTVVVMVGVFLLYKQLLFTTFDEETARAFGIRTHLMDTYFSLALAAAIIVSMQRIGVMLIAAAVVIPPITARLLTDRFDRMMIISTLMGSLTALVGLYISFYMDVSSGSAIVLTQATLFLIAIGYTSIRKRNRLAAIHYHV